MYPTTKTVIDALNFEHEAMAEKVATLLVRACGDADAAEAVLEKLIEGEASEDNLEFWKEIITALAQMRG